MHSPGPFLHSRSWWWCHQLLQTEISWWVISVTSWSSRHSWNLAFRAPYLEMRSQACRKPNSWFLKKKTWFFSAAENPKFPNFLLFCVKCQLCQFAIVNVSNVSLGLPMSVMSVCDCQCQYCQFGMVNVSNVSLGLSMSVMYVCDWMPVLSVWDG